MGQRNEAEVGGDTRDIRLAGSMHYERAALVEWSIPRGCRARIREEDRQIG
jgi:hypothetical protein